MPTADWKWSSCSGRASSLIIGPRPRDVSRRQASTHACWKAREASGKPAGGEREVEPRARKGAASAGWHMRAWRRRRGWGSLRCVRYVTLLRCQVFFRIDALPFFGFCACFRSVPVFSLQVRPAWRRRRLVDLTS